MNIVDIVRLSTNYSIGTVGILRINKSVMCFTLEPYKRDNQRNVSCIPTGQYTCKPYTRRSGVQTWEITGVQGRSHIIFHVGNHLRDTQGCVLLGTEVCDTGVVRSTEAFTKMIVKLDLDEEFILTITEEY